MPLHSNHGKSIPEGTYIQSLGNSARWKLPLPNYFETKEVHVSASAPRGFTRDEGRPLGAGLRELVSNHLKLLW